MGSKLFLNASKDVKLIENWQLNLGWDEDFCKHLNKIAQEDHSYVVTWQERQWYEKEWSLCINSQGPVGPKKSQDQTLSKQYEEFVKLNGKLKRLDTRFTPHFVPSSKFDNDQDNNSSNLGNLLLGQLIRKQVGMVAVFGIVFFNNMVNTTPHRREKSNAEPVLQGGSCEICVPVEKR